MAAAITLPMAVDHVLGALGYHFSNPRHLAEALRAAGSGYNLNPSPTVIDGHKRLAYMGTAVMKAAVLCDWYASGTDRAVANYRIGRIESTEILSEFGRRIGLEACISTNPSQGVQPPTSAVIARAVQALFGAIWIDSQENMQEVRRVLQSAGLLSAPSTE